MIYALPGNEGTHAEDVQNNDALSLAANVANSQDANRHLPSDGIMQDKFLQGFIKAMKDKVFATWEKDTVEQRIANANSVIDSLTREAILPQLVLRTDTSPGELKKLTRENAQFEMRRWTILARADLFARGPLSAEQEKELAATLVHEIRHSEQIFNILRYVEPSGWRFHGFAVPKHIVELARARPLNSSSELGARTKELYESTYGLHRAKRNQIMAKMEDAEESYQAAVKRYGRGSQQARTAEVERNAWHDAYLNLPIESDAFAAGQKLNQIWEVK